MGGHGLDPLESLGTGAGCDTEDQKGRQARRGGKGRMAAGKRIGSIIRMNDYAVGAPNVH